MPAGAIEDQHGMRADRDVGRDLLEMPLHRIGVGAGQRERPTHCARRTNGAEQIGALITLVSRLARSCSAPRPLAHEAVLLTDARLILKPNLDRRSLRQIGQVDVQDLGEVFLKDSTMRSSCFGWRGRALMCEKPSFLRSFPTERSW